MTNVLKNLPPLPGPLSGGLTKIELTNGLKDLKNLEYIKSSLLNNLDNIDEDVLKSLDINTQNLLIVSLKSNIEKGLGKVIPNLNPSVLGKLTTEQLNSLATNSDFLNDLKILPSKITKFNPEQFSSDFVKSISIDTFQQITDGRWWIKFAKTNPSRLTEIGGKDVVKDLLDLDKIWIFGRFSDLKDFTPKTEFLRLTINNINTNSFTRTLSGKALSRLKVLGDFNIKKIIFIGVTSAMVIGASICAAGGEDFMVCLGKQVGKVVGTTTNEALKVGKGTLNELFPGLEDIKKSIQDKVGQVMDNLSDMFPGLSGIFSVIYNHFFIIVFVAIAFLVLN
jgi:hypothetical protein